MIDLKNLDSNNKNEYQNKIHTQYGIWYYYLIDSKYATFILIDVRFSISKI